MVENLDDRTGFRADGRVTPCQGDSRRWRSGNDHAAIVVDESGDSDDVARLEVVLGNGVDVTSGREVELVGSAHAAHLRLPEASES